MLEKLILYHFVSFIWKRINFEIPLSGGMACTLWLSSIRRFIGWSTQERINKHPPIMSSQQIICLIVREEVKCSRDRDSIAFPPSRQSNKTRTMNTFLSPSPAQCLLSFVLISNVQSCIVATLHCRWWMGISFPIKVNTSPRSLVQVEEWVNDLWNNLPFVNGSFIARRFIAEPKDSRCISYGITLQTPVEDTLKSIGIPR